MCIRDRATLANGETSGTVVLEDGRVVTVEDNIVTSIEMEDTESLEDRVVLDPLLTPIKGRTRAFLEKVGRAGTRTGHAL